MSTGNERRGDTRSLWALARCMMGYYEDADGSVAAGRQQTLAAESYI